MPKLEAVSLTQSIGLDQIIDTGNIRGKEKYGPNEKGGYPPEIIELAESIKSIGQIQPIILKELEPVDGLKRFELIAGFRRRAAFEYLKSKGDDYNRINATIFSGEKSIIQLVENIQRVDLSSREREAGIYQLLESGIKQNEIAAKLSKSKSYVSIHVSAYKMRLLAEGAGIDTKNIETTTFGELLSIPEKSLVSVIKDLVNFGGTRAAANQLARAFKEPPPEAPAPEKKETPRPVVNPPPPSGADNIDPLKNLEDEKKETEPEPPIEPETPPIKPEVKKAAPKKDDFEAEHLVVDVNTILKIILNYIDETTGERQEAAKNILALIHKELDHNGG